MSTSEPFTIIEDEGSHQPQVYKEFQKGWSSSYASIDVQLIVALQQKHPDLIVTAVPGTNVNLLQFAAAGFATATLDSAVEPVVRLRGFVPPPPRGDGTGYLADANLFARYNYRWNDEYFILYTVYTDPLGGTTQFILKEPVREETAQSHSSITDKLIRTIGEWVTKKANGIWVYDGYWRKDTSLWEQVQKADWKDVILDEKKKKDLRSVSKKFFDNEDVYKRYGVPWKRGLIFHGPVGNGKTISIKAMMKEMIERGVEALYVKSAPYTYNIGDVFNMVRKLAPCLLVLEDIETIVTEQTRSYFFNEVDGLESNDGLLMVASTNYLDRLDPGLSKRPSRFDRKYLFPLPNKEERRLYSLYWYQKLKEQMEFPKSLCSAIAGITAGFSFAYLKEAFVTTLLEIANKHNDDDSSIVDTDDDMEDDLDRYEFWRAFKQ
ncbi:P-loop containing nucleoside triphosphate hydrolase protein [Pseudovirgaria hyperparasitica]|uniref:P-loop containing nucleoside triphosphate hydrolase protein n=1 Tax=Pseudovirgaria hyperparasitica TaxID=470096 RepID=A0A6A6W694_9PEZI|nr:P-loop containing nucleoside triphosphate hydrolase protein [Pseudovirgaria hyperparasitica]KAF2757077.1 P-loop containing nucleoside triphosphate hydrolase protein [Pseudovirgaria hyperparasitica]